MDINFHNEQNRNTYLTRKADDSWGKVINSSRISLRRWI